MTSDPAKGADRTIQIKFIRYIANFVRTKNNLDKNEF